MDRNTQDFTNQLIAESEVGGYNDTFFFHGASFSRRSVRQDGIWCVVFQQIPMLFDSESWGFVGRDESIEAIAWLDEFCRQNLGGDRAALARHMAATWNGSLCPS